MKRLIVAIALLLIPAVAYAGWNIRQKDDGSTVWTNEDSKDVPVGDSGLTVQVTDVSTAGSAYITSHKAGKLKKIYAVIDNTLSGSSVVFSFHVSDYQTNNTTNGPTPISTGATITFPVAGAAGDMVSVSPLLDTSVPSTGMTDTVNQGDVIIVYTNGASTGAATATITFIIE